MTDMIGAIQNTVPITQFDRGMAEKIFAAVKEGDIKVVIKNNVPECVLLPPDEYVRIIEELEDVKLLSLAAERLEHYDSDNFISREELMKAYDITEEMLDELGDIEIE